MASQRPSAGEFAFLTAKQKAVLDLLANHRSSKEIAATLGLSETSVNRRFEAVRNRLGGISRPELARRYALWLAEQDENAQANTVETAETGQLPCVESALKILQLAGDGTRSEEAGRDSDAREAVFEDPVAMSIEAPWKEWSEPRIVPRVLDGDNATLTRGATIAILLFAIVASIVVGLAAAKALADAVS